MGCRNQLKIQCPQMEQHLRCPLRTSYEPIFIKLSVLELLGWMGSKHMLKQEKEIIHENLDFEAIWQRLYI